MAQLTIRADEELIRRIKQSAANLGRSMNEYVTSVLDAATDPDLADTAAERLRERLEHRGPARVFEAEEAAMHAVTASLIKAGANNVAVNM